MIEKQKNSGANRQPDRTTSNCKTGVETTVRYVCGAVQCKAALVAHVEKKVYRNMEDRVLLIVLIFDLMLFFCWCLVRVD